MNRSLLLVICDFLLLSLLALARFDDPSEPVEVIEAAEAEAVEAVASEDMIEVLKLALENERNNKSNLTSELSLTQEELEEQQKALEEREKTIQEKEQTIQERESSLNESRMAIDALQEQRTQLEQERRDLEAANQKALDEQQALAASMEATRNRLAQAESDRIALAKTLAESKESSAMSSERMKYLQEELKQQQATLEELQTTKSQLEQEKRNIELEKQTLATELKVAQTQTQVMQQTLLNARADIEANREEKLQIQQTTQKLAEGVTVLAESTDQIRKEVEQLQPQSLNTIFDGFKQNRVTIKFTSQRAALLGGSEREDRVQTILVTDGNYTYSVMHVEQTPFAKSGLKQVSGVLYLGGKAYRIGQVGFLAADPRILVTSVPKDIAEQAGITPFTIALDPLRFPEAVLVDSQESYYGESEFKLLPTRSDYMQMQTTLMSRVFGEFSPKRSDLVFAKTGEFIGIMVNKNFASVVGALDVNNTLKIGDSFNERMSELVLERSRSLKDTLERDLR